MPLVKVTVDLSEVQKAYVIQKSSELGISQSVLIRMAVEQYLDRGGAESEASLDVRPSFSRRGRGNVLSGSDWVD